MKAVTDFIFLGYKITEEGDCSSEIKRCLLLERKGMTNLDSVLKRRDITLTIKVHIPKAMRLLIFLMSVLIPACDSSSLAFHIMYSAYKLNKQRVLLQLDCKEIKPVNPKGNKP